MITVLEPPSADVVPISERAAGGRDFWLGEALTGATDTEYARGWLAAAAAARTQCAGEVRLADEEAAHAQQVLEGVREILNAVASNTAIDANRRSRITLAIMDMQAVYVILSRARHACLEGKSQ